MLDWILERLPAVVFVVLFLAKVVQGVLKARKDRREEAPARPDALAEERRTREVQEDIRRKIAARRAGRTVEAPPAPEAPPPLVMREDPTVLPVPEPLKRMLRELEQRVQPAPEPVAPPPLADRSRSELERQQRLADEMKALEEQRALVARRAANIAALKAEEARSQGALRAAARGRVLDDLRDPESLRRAFVLREVLGTPVGLR